MPAPLMAPTLLQPDQLDELRDALSGAKHLFVDTEFHAEHRYLPRLFLLQVAADDGPVLLVDCTDLQALAPLAEVLLAAPWVVHGGRSDLRLLHDVLGALPDTVWDTQVLAGLVEPAFPSSFQSLVRRWLGEHLSKSATLTDWKQRPLSEEQLTYAQEDVQWLRPLFYRLQTELTRRDRVELAERACSDAARQAIDGPDLNTLWRRLDAAWSLSSAQASVLRELIAWRERAARDDNQPPRRVLSDGLAFELARRSPRSLATLQDDRRFPRGLLKRHGDELLRQIAIGLRREELDPPGLVSRFSVQATTAAWLHTLAQIEGRRAGWSADLVLPKSLIWDLTLGAPTRESIASTLGWRDSLFGDRCHQALHGPVEVRLHDGEWSCR